MKKEDEVGSLPADAAAFAARPCRQHEERSLRWWGSFLPHSEVVCQAFTKRQKGVLVFMQEGGVVVGWQLALFDIYRC